MIAALTAAMLAACGNDGDRAGSIERPDGTASTTDPTTLHGLVSEEPFNVGDLTYDEVTTGGTNGPFEFVAPPGGVLTVYFGYTFCPDICPTTMSDLAAALAALEPTDAAKLSIAFVTVDPTRDTPEVLTNYLANFFDDNYHALRDTDWATLHALENRFLVTSEIALNPDGSTEVGHSSVMAVVDDTGEVRVMWPFGVTADDMASDLDLIMNGVAT